MDFYRCRFTCSYNFNYNFTIMRVRKMQVPERILNWTKGIGTNTPEEMASLYSKEAVLVPTFANILKGQKKIKEYRYSYLVGNWFSSSFCWGIDIY